MVMSVMIMIGRCIFFAMISGVAHVVYAVDNKENGNEI